MSRLPANRDGAPGSASSTGWRTGARPAADVMADLQAVEARLWSLLDPYLSRGLVRSTIYGMPSLTWPGARAHDYFAAVKPARAHVGLFLLVADTYPDALEGTSP